MVRRALARESAPAHGTVAQRLDLEVLPRARIQSYIGRTADVFSVVQKNDKSRASREFDARFLDAHRHNQISFARAPKRLRCSEFAAIIEKVVPATGTSSIIANRSPVRSSSASGFPEPPPPLSLPKFCRRLPRGVAARVGRAARFALLTLA